MAKLTICVGLPASGKSTYASQQEGATIICKDDIRTQLTEEGWVWSPEKEKDVLKIRDLRISKVLEAGGWAIIADTNLAPKHQARLKQLAQQYGATFEIKDFTDVPVETCLERNRLRSGTARIPSNVIRQMAKDYLGWVEPTPTFAPYTWVKGLPDAIICDLDGTLCWHQNRSPYDFNKCDTDLPNPAVVAVIDAFKNKAQIIYMSGRDDSCKEKTEEWLLNHARDGFLLYMRETGDNRKDSIVKGEMFDANIRGRYNVVFCLDDRQQVVDFYRSIGLTVFQVAPGNF